MTLYEKIISVMSGTPLWVWPLFVFVIYRGLQAYKSLTYSLYNLAIISAIFLVLSIKGMYTSQSSTSGMWIVWCSGLLLGMVQGWYIFKTSPVKADKKSILLEFQVRQ